MTATPNHIEQARLLDLTNDAIMVRDLSDNIVFWNKGAEHLYGWRSEEVIGKHLHTLLKTEFPKAYQEIINDLHRDGKFSGEVVQFARDGRRVPSLCRWVLDLKTQSILTSYTDISDRKAAELQMARIRDQALAAVKAKDQFLAAVSHELRTPLNPVLLMASEGAEDQTIPLHIREIFEMIVKNVALEARLIDDLLDVSRITHGKMTVEMTLVDVHATLREAVSTVRSEFDGKKVELILDIAATKPVVRGEAIRLQQVYWNLLRNAAEFTPAGGSVRVATSVPRAGILQIRVSDTGIGMSENELARLFDPFAQGDHADNNGNRNRFGGLGLGLTISRMLVELHLGTIRAESGGVNEGSTFWVELPLNNEDSGIAKLGSIKPQAPIQTKVGSREADKQYRVLLVEDHEDTRIALVRLLRFRNFQVVAVSTVKEAEIAAENTLFDLVISDIGLPDGNGFELMAGLRERYGLSGIALSGYGANEDRAHSKEAGFFTHLIKPVNIQLLDIALAEWPKVKLG